MNLAGAASLVFGLAVAVAAPAGPRPPGGAPVSSSALLSTLLAPGPRVEAQETEASPQEGEAGLAAARRALSRGDAQTALSLLRVIRLDRPEDPRVHLLLGHAHQILDDAVAATESYLEAIRLAPDDPEAHLALGSLEERAGNLEAAASAYEKAVELAPAHPRAHAMLGATRLRQQRHGGAVASLRRHVELQPDDLRARNLLAWAERMNDATDAALEQYAAVLARDPDDPEAHRGTGEILARRPGRRAEALEHLRRYLELRGDDATVLYLIGRTHVRLEQWEEAREALERSIELDPGAAQTHYQLGRVYSRLGDREAAGTAMEAFDRLEHADRAEESRRKRLETLRNAIGEALNQRRVDEARRLLAEFRELVPGDLEAWLLTARARLWSDDPQGGLEAAERALELEPGQWEALYLKGLALHATGNLEGARQALVASLEDHPLFAETHASLGNVLLGLDRVEEAVEAYERAISLEPERAPYHLNLATAYGRLGLDEEEAAAMAEYRRLLRLRRRRPRPDTTGRAPVGRQDPDPPRDDIVEPGGRAGPGSPLSQRHERIDPAGPPRRDPGREAGDE